jgi:hypothetical protein
MQYVSNAYFIKYLSIIRLKKQIDHTVSSVVYLFVDHSIDRWNLFFSEIRTWSLVIPLILANN